MNSVKNVENAKKRINFFKRFFKGCLFTGYDMRSDQQNSEICCLFDVFIKTNAPWALKYQNEYFDKFYEPFYREVLKVSQTLKIPSKIYRGLYL